jgi:uncharacterized membrane protein YhaH (DUF805 family)
MENQEQTSNTSAGTDNSTPIPDTPIVQASKTTRFAPFSGRIGRLHFFIGFVILLGLSYGFPLLPINTYINIPIQLLSSILIVALTIRRLHDIGSSGWQALLPVALIFGMIVSIFWMIMLGLVGMIVSLVLTVILILFYIKLFFRKGDPTINIYGEVPAGRPFVQSVLNIQ